MRRFSERGCTNLAWLVPLLFYGRGLGPQPAGHRDAVRTEDDFHRPLNPSLCDERAVRCRCQHTELGSGRHGNRQGTPATIDEENRDPIHRSRCEWERWPANTGGVPRDAWAGEGGASAHLLVGVEQTHRTASGTPGLDTVVIEAQFYIIPPGALRNQREAPSWAQDIDLPPWLQDVAQWEWARIGYLQGC